ncbi:hypothetical protein BJV78DRAFT_1286525 [Lactifluus subvellereus]|nr:hypothetical protein BJV78DRAFT_1286525 [Lactifluus subvellereus]
MSSRTRLPVGLLDLVFLRVSARWPSHVSLRDQRCMQQAALISHPSSTFPEPPVVSSSLSSRATRRRRQALSALGSPATDPGLASELARRVEALAIPTENEGNNPSDVAYSEEELLAFYEDILALPNDEAGDIARSSEKLPIEEQDKAVVEAILSRITPSPTPSLSSETLADLLLQRVEPASSKSSNQTQPPIHEKRSLLPHHLALSLLTPVVQELTSTRNAPSSASGQDSLPIPLAILSIEEWRSLTRLCLTHDDPHSAKIALEFMMASGIELIEGHANDVMEWYVVRGDVLGLEQFMQTFVKGTLTDRQRHLHIKTHEKSVPPGTIPESALSLLHAYENVGRPAPMTAYSRIIAALFRTSSSLAHAQAWDLFSHMRYVAHPRPDALLFTQMIHACALPTPAEPERALDLFTEMTIDRGIPPTAGAYTAAILACARSGSKVYANEAFRLAKEMLDSHRDARGRGAFHPDSHTFAALLESAKRIGDLGRVRWILAEMVEVSRRNPESKDVVVDERIMTHVFHSYAAYKPPFNRSMAPLADQNDNKGDADITGASPTTLASPTEPVGSSAVDREPSAAVEMPQESSFAHLPPQSRSEVLGEIRALFSRISHSSHSSPTPRTCPPPGPLPALPDVHATPRLLNAYLSALYAHASLEAAHEAFRTTFAERGLEKDAVTLVEALERCACARRGRERASVSGFAEDAWREWTRLENDTSPTRRASARHVQRAYSARVRVLALTGRIDEALACLRAFVARYPPYVVREQSPPPPTRLSNIRTMRVSLAGARPLVRLTTALDVRDDHVPPLLTFADLETLHHRLVAAGDLKGLAYVKWVCKAYEGALRRRREAALKV